MKSIISFITVIAFFFATLPAPLYAMVPTGAENETGEVTDTENVNFATLSKVTPIVGGVVVTPMVGKIGVLKATIPFVNDHGQLLDFKVNFNTSTWTIEDTSGVVAGGVLGSEQSATLKLYALDQLKPLEQRTKNTAVVVGIIALIVAALALGFQVASYLNDLEQAGNNAISQGNLCAGSMARDTATALSQGRSCFTSPERISESGSICWSTPEYRNGDPDQCLGMTFVGCQTTCN